MTIRRPLHDEEPIPAGIPESELVFETARSGGPGGQNVNKVETKVRVVFDYCSSNVLSWKQKSTLARDSNIIRSCNPHGHIVVTSQQYRSQAMNRAAAVKKLMSLLRVALAPKLERIKTKTPRGSKQTRRQGKSHRAHTKALRRSPGKEE